MTHPVAILDQCSWYPNFRKGGLVSIKREATLYRCFWKTEHRLSMTHYLLDERLPAFAPEHELTISTEKRNPFAPPSQWAAKLPNNSAKEHVGIVLFIVEFATTHVALSGTTWIAIHLPEYGNGYVSASLCTSITEE